MCESNAFLADGDKERLVLEDVAFIRPEGEMLRLRNIFGEEKTLRAEIREINLLEHKIVLVEK